MLNQCGVRIGEDGPDISLPFAFDSGRLVLSISQVAPVGNSGSSCPHGTSLKHALCRLHSLYLSSTQPGSTSKELLAFKGLANFGLWLLQSPNLRHFFELLLSDRREMID